jgi:plastocyanin
MTSFTSSIGIPVAAGDRLRLTASYDNSLPHTRVMGIMIVYLAPAPVSGCPSIPPLELDPGTPGPPPLAPLPIATQPKGPVRKVRGTWVGDYRFGVGRAQVKAGSMFTWRFVGSVSHNVTLANGPIGFSSPSLRGGATYSYRFARKGVYQLVCSLHPVAMTEIVTVR